MKLKKNHVSNSNRDEDPLRNEKSLKDKALMTGQQKVKKKMYSTNTLHAQ